MPQSRSKWTAYLSPSSPSNRAEQSRDSGIEMNAPRTSGVSTQDAHSTTSSSRPMLGDTSMNSNNSSVDPPSPSPTRTAPPASPDPKHHGLTSESSSVSLSVNYLPSKFSSNLLAAPGSRKRKPTKSVQFGIPKLGGGVDAFKNGESRISDDRDEDYNGVQSGWFGDGKGHKKMRWNRFKWILFIANLCLTIYSLIALIFCLLTWFDVWTQADVVRVGNRTELIMSSFAACLGLFTSLIGWSGILLNNRSFLAIYTFMLWISFIFLVIPGYLTYKRRTFNLEGKINAQWSQDLGAEGRMRIQNQLRCCGYFSPYVEATVSQTCYARSILPGCKLGYLEYERVVLKRWYSVSFALVPIHIAIMTIGLLCSNHVTYRFGKGMMPKAYRLSLTSMAIIMDNYANQLAEQYGSDVASEVLARSRSNLQLDAAPAMYGDNGTAGNNTKYDQVGSRAPEGSI